mgnify:CR=1 FL=1
MGTAEEIILGHTLLPYFLPFKSQELASNAIACMRGPSLGSLKFQLGLLTSRFRAHLPLKACPECIRRDTARFAVAYWHRSHQLPGVWLCPEHGTALHEASQRTTGEQRFGWCLPSERTLLDLQPFGRTLDTGDLRENLLRLAEAAVGLCLLPKDWRFSALRLEHCYRAALVRAGFASATGRMRLEALGQSYLSFASDLRMVSEFESLPADLAEATQQGSRMLYRTASATHPLRHLLLIVWLYGSWAAFLDQYRRTSATSGAQTATKAPPTDPRRAVAIELAKDPGCSARAIATAVGVDVSTVMAWLCHAGVPTSRRPKKLTGTTRQTLLGLLRRGSDKQVAADATGVSLTTVTRILLTEVGLHLAWKQAREHAARRRARATWGRLLAKNPASPIPTLRTLAGSAYAWLYRNDRAWLADQHANRPGPAHQGGLRVSWDARDDALAAQVRQAVLQLASQGIAGPVPAWRVCQEVPALKAKLGQLDRFPLTRKALASVLLRHRRASEADLFE